MARLGAEARRACSKWCAAEGGDKRGNGTSAGRITNQYNQTGHGFTKKRAADTAEHNHRIAEHGMSRKNQLMNS